jgi:uncharacterized protein
VLSRPVAVSGQAIIGATLGATIDAAALADLGGRWVPVGIAVGATLAASLGAGLLVSAMAGVDRPTALLGLVAGGASGIVAMSDELGADARLVAVMQYVRVFAVVALAPVLAAVVVDRGIAGGGSGADGAGLGVDAAFTLAACGGGLLLARRLPVPAAALLAPLAIAAALTAAGVDGDVPALVEHLGFAAIGLQVGLRFTRETLRRVGRLLPAVLLAVAGLIAACAGLAAVLAAVADLSFLDAYLATTPGGIYAVLATAVGSGADTAFVLAVQALRLLVMVLAAPPLVRLLA